MRDGEIVASGHTREVLTEDTRRSDVFDLPCRVIEDPVTGSPLVLPLGRSADRREVAT